MTFLRSRYLNVALLATLLPSILFWSSGCVTRRVSRELTQVEKIKDLNKRRQYLKVHLKSGELYVLHSWSVNEASKTISGYGNFLDFNRKLKESRGGMSDNSRGGKQGAGFQIPFSEVVVVETNDTGSNPGVAAMIVTGLITIPIAILCVTNPKSCFGSCPTFYVHRDSTSKLVAEGFSSSISRSLEETDVDLINFPLKPGDPLQLTVKNEALETHMIQHIRLLELPHSEGGRVFQDLKGTYYETHSAQPPVRADFQEKSILNALATRDDVEWFTQADSSNLATKIDVHLDFKNPGADAAIILDKRQSLMTTFLFYHSLALSGRQTAYYMTEMETRKPYLKDRLNRMYDLLGGIEVFVQQSNGKWNPAGVIREAGPIVSDFHLVKLPSISGETARIKLRMTRGLWRINCVNMVSVSGEVKPRSMDATLALREGKNDTTAVRKLRDGSDYLVTFPGESYDLVFSGEVKTNADYYIESKGYYIEWMRDEWLKEENIRAAKSLLIFPSRFLKKSHRITRPPSPAWKKFSGTVSLLKLNRHTTIALFMIVMLCWAGCKSNVVLAPKGSVPKRNAMAYDAYGSYITVVTKDERSFEGELIGLRRDSLVILGRELHMLSRHDIAKGKVIVHAPHDWGGAYLIMIPNLALLGVGGFGGSPIALAFELSLIDLIGISSVVGTERAKLNYYDWSEGWDIVLRYSRYPYEIPDNIDLTKLTARPPTKP